MDDTPLLTLLTVTEVAEMLKVSRPQVYRLLDYGLPYIRLHPRSDLRFDRDDVAAWIETRKVVAAS
jgi:excisionase family DNA binding protein